MPQLDFNISFINTFLLIIFFLFFYLFIYFSLIKVIYKILLLKIFYIAKSQIVLKKQNLKYISCNTKFDFENLKTQNFFNHILQKN